MTNNAGTSIAVVIPSSTSIKMAAATFITFDTTRIDRVAIAEVEIEATIIAGFVAADVSFGTGSTAGVTVAAVINPGTNSVAGNATNAVRGSDTIIVRTGVSSTEISSWGLFSSSSPKNSLDQ